MNTAVDLPLNVMPRTMPGAMIDALRGRFAERFVTSLAVREQHGRDESPFDVPPPEAPQTPLAFGVASVMVRDEPPYIASV